MNIEKVAPVNEFWNRKIRFYFNEILDVNSDGVINDNDIEIFRNLYCQMKNLADDSPALTRFSYFLDSWFKEIRRTDDSKSDCHDIGINEFLTYCTSVRQQLYGLDDLPNSLSYLKDYFIALFHILDTNGDNIISKQDYLLAYSDFEDTSLREEYWRRLSRCDDDKINENFKIDQELFTKLCIEFLVSTKPDDGGNWLFGIF